MRKIDAFPIGDGPIKSVKGLSETKDGAYLNRRENNSNILPTAFELESVFLCIQTQMETWVLFLNLIACRLKLNHWFSDS